MSITFASFSSISQRVSSESGGGGSSSKFYFEFEYYANDPYGGFGFTTNTSLNGTHPNEQSSNFVGFRSNGEGVGSSGTGFTHNAAIAAFNSSTTRFGIAFNYGTGEFWVRRGSSSWSLGDPVAGTNPQGTVPANNENIKLFFTAYSQDYLYGVPTASSGYSYDTPSGYTTVRLNAFAQYYTLGSISFSLSNYKATNSNSSSYSGAFIVLAPFSDVYNP